MQMAVTETPPGVDRASPGRREDPERFTIGPRGYRRLADFALVMLTLIVFSGSAVRLTGSGLGCPDWPQCDGEFLPTQLDSHVAVEYGNRLISALVGVPCLLVGLLVFRRRPFRRDLVVPALLLPLGVLAQGVLGGLTVLLELRWQVVIGHYLLSMVLLLGGTVLAWRLRQDPGRAPPRQARRLVLATRALVAYGALVIVLGTFATATGPHAGGAGTGDVIPRLTAIDLQTMIYAHGHPAALLGFASIALWWHARRRARPEHRRALTAACLLLGAQGAVGVAQYHLALPAELVWVHASLAAVLWISLVWSWLAAGEPA